jgi:hypothetical protein
MDESRDNHFFELPHAGRYHIKHTFCNRVCVRGRATRVYLLEKVSQATPQSAPTAQLSGRYPTRHGYSLRSDSKILLAAATSAPAYKTLACHQTVPELQSSEPFPHQVVLKDTFR